MFLSKACGFIVAPENFILIITITTTTTTTTTTPAPALAPAPAPPPAPAPAPMLMLILITIFLKPNLLPSLGSMANLNATFLEHKISEGNYQSTGPRHKHSIVFIIHH